jgi:hypothetical protein
MKGELDISKEELLTECRNEGYRLHLIGLDKMSKLDDYLVEY